jgi:porin
MQISRRFSDVKKAIWGVMLVFPIAHVAKGQETQPQEPADQATTAAPVAEETATTSVDEEVQSFDLRTTKTLTGDWGGLRTDLEDAGISFKIRLMNQIMVNMRGGKETTNGHDTSGTLDFDISFDLEKMKLIDGATFFIRGKSSWGGDDSDFDREKIGAFFKVNHDVGAEEPIFVDKWWWQQRLADGRIDLRLGRLQPDKELFDTSKVIGNEDDQFLNRALVRNGILPSNKGLGAFINVDITDTFYARAAAIDAQAKDRRVGFDTAFHDEDEFRFYGEVGCKPAFETPKGKLDGHYRLGAIYDPTRKTRYYDRLDGVLPARQESGDWAGYVGFDQMVWKENDDPKDKQGISVAGRYGFAHGEVNLIEHFWSVAAQYAGLVPSRDKDVLGFGVAQGIFSDDYKYVSANIDRETVYELYYSIQAAPWLTISPDLQVVTNPGGHQDDRDAFIAGMRFKMML